MVVMLIRRAIKRFKKTGYSRSTAQALNAEGDEEFKFLAVADVELTKQANVGIFGRPSIIMGVKNIILGMTGFNRKVLAVVQTKDGQIYFLAFKAKDLSILDDPNILNGENFDSGFAADNGLSVLTVDNTCIKIHTEDAFTIYPDSTRRLKRALFDIKIVEDLTNPASSENAEQMRRWLQNTTRGH